MFFVHAEREHHCMVFAAFKLRQIKEPPFCTTIFCIFIDTGNLLEKAYLMRHSVDLCYMYMGLLASALDHPLC